MSLVNVDFDSRNARPNPGSPNGSSTKKRNDIYNIDVLDLVRRKLALILFFVLLSLALSVLYFLTAPKTYESTAKVFVDEKSAPTLNGGDRDSMISDTSLEQYIVTLKSTKILAPAADVGEFDQMKMFEPFDDILFELREGDTLDVGPADTKSNSGVIKIALRGRSQEECKIALQAIVDSFEQHIRATTKNIGGEHAKIVEKAQTQWLTRLKEVEKEIEDLSIQPELVNVEGRITNRYQTDLILLRQDLHDLQKEKNKILALVETIRSDQMAGRTSEDLVTAVMSEASEVTDNAYVRTQEQLVLLKMEEQDLLNEFGADHPNIRAVRRKINAVEAIRSQELDAMKGINREVVQQVNAKQNLVADFVKQMERKAVLLEAEELQVQRQIDGLQDKSKSVSAVVEKLASLQRERERLETGYYATIETMSEMDALKEHLWRNLSVLDPPSVAEEVAPRLPLCLGAGLILGGMLGLVFAGFKEIAEKTFHSSDDVGDLLDTQVIGHISLFQKARLRERNSKFPKVLPELVALHAPASQASEAYRAIRTSLYFKTQQTGAKVIQITSPTPGDGKSTTISNLAISIAQSGRRALLIDADLRKPTQHKLFGLSNATGLGTAIAGEAGSQDVIQTVIPEYLSVLSAGPLVANPAELLTSARFVALLEGYRNKYDYVLVDTPPLLAVTDPSIVCTHVDLVYMVMRIRNGVRSNATRAKEIINSMNIELSGVIINGLRRRDQKHYEYSGQYGYGSYSYGKTARNANAIIRSDRPTGSKSGTPV
jgi:capsular exopolysaccharide synthesis family protein